MAVQTLREIAPRLYAAHKAEQARLLILDVRIKAVRSEMQRLERLVGHRELQAARAVSACGSARGRRAQRRAGEYLVERERKLEEAEAALARYRRRLRRLERER